MNKKNILIIGFLIVFFGTAYIQYKNSYPIKEVVSIATLTIKLSVSIDDKKKDSTIVLKRGQTALQALASKHAIITKGEKGNAFITSIDGRIASDSKKEFWSFYVNGKQAQVGAGSYFVKNNDTIEWKIETY